MQYFPKYQYPFPEYNNFISLLNNVFIYPGFNYPQGSYMPTPDNIQTPENK